MATTAIRYKHQPVSYIGPCGNRLVYNPSNNSFERIYVKSDTVARPRPPGIERLFRPTSYSHSTQTLDSDLGWIPVTASCSGVVRSGLKPVHFRDEYGASIPSCPIPSYVASELRSRLLEKIKDQKVNIGMLLATYSQTASLCQGVASELVGIYRDAKRGRLDRVVRGGSRLWLAYRYGLAPMASDLKGLLIETDSSLNNRGLLMRYQAGLSWDNSFSRFYGSPSSERPVKVTGKSKAVAYVEFDNLELQRASQLGLTNVPFLLYDLIPFSFMADWVLDVGSYLNDLDTMLGVKRHSATISHKALALEQKRIGTIGYRSSRSVTSRAVLDLTPRLEWGTGLNLLRSADLAALASLKVRGWRRLARTILISNPRYTE